VLRKETAFPIIIVIIIMMCRSQALGIALFAGRVGGLLAPFTSLMVRILCRRLFATSAEIYKIKWNTKCEEKAVPTLNTELTKNYSAMQGLL